MLIVVVPYDASSRQWPTPLGKMKLFLFSGSPLQPNVPCTVLGILLLLIRLSSGNSPLKVNFLLNECSYAHSRGLRSDVQKRNYLAVIFSWTPEMQECQPCPNSVSLLFPQQNDIQLLSLICRAYMKNNRKHREREKGGETLINCF